MSDCGTSFQSPRYCSFWYSFRQLISKAAEKLHCALLGSVEGPGAMVAAGKVLITFKYLEQLL